MEDYRDPNNNLPSDYNDSYVPYETKYNSSKIRLCIFPITSVCVGLPALVWAFRLLHLHRKIRGRISAFIVLLLLGDLIHLLISLYTVIELLKRDRYWLPGIILQFYSALSLCGFYLHQLVALEAALSLKYPLFSAHIFSISCYIIISILVFFFSIGNVLFFFMHHFHAEKTFNFLFNIGTCLAPLSLLVVTFTITCKASSTPVSKNTRSILIVAIVNFVMLYLPFMLVISVHFFSLYRDDTSWIEMSICLLSLRVVPDTVLCVLFCRENLRDVQTPQTHRAIGVKQIADDP